MSSDQGTSGIPPELVPHFRKTLENLGINDATLQKMIAEANAAFSIMVHNGWDVSLTIEKEASPTHRTGRPFINFEASGLAGQEEPSQEVLALMTVVTTAMRSAELFSDIATGQGMDVEFAVETENVNGKDCPQIRARMINLTD